MNFAANRLWIVGLGLALFAPASTAAQSVRGEMGPLSRGSILISVSVSPRLQTEQILARANSLGLGDAGAAPTLSIASNAHPSLRYSVITLATPSMACLAKISPKDAGHDAFEECAAVRQTGREGRAAPLVLIVSPD